MVSFKDPLGGVKADLEEEGKFATDKGVCSDAAGVEKWSAAAPLLDGNVTESNETDDGALSWRFWKTHKTKLVYQVGIITNIQLTDKT